MPEWGEEVRRRLKSARLRGAAEADVVEELVQHLEDRFAELCARGESPADARRIALLELDDEDSLGVAVRGAKQAPPEPVALGADAGVTASGARGTLVGVYADLRVGARMLRRSPGFTIVATLVIALGIGANTALFSVLNTMLLRPLPGVSAPEQLAKVFTSDFSGPIHGASSYPDFEAMRESGVFDGVAVYEPSSFSIAIDERGIQVLGEVVSAEYFDVLGVRPVAGRFFLSDESGTQDAPPVVVISHDFWQNRLSGVPDVVGRALRVNSHMLTIVGVAPPEFGGVMRGVGMDVWVPTGSPAGGDDDFTNRGNRGFLVVARLREGTMFAATQQRLTALAAQLHAEYPAQWTDINDRSRVLTLRSEAETRVPHQARGPVLGMFALLVTVVGVVLLVACSNVANLMLTRASARRSEMGIRLALGATRGRIVRQLLAESVLLASLGGVAGVLLAQWLVSSLDNLPFAAAMPVRIDFGLDGRVLLFGALITLLTGIMFGLAPALHGSRAPAPLMRDGARAGSRSRLRNVLVVVQVAASVVLLVGGGLFLRTLMAAQRIDTGVDTENMALMSFDLRTEGYSPEQAEQFYAQLQDQVAAVPGVTSVALAQRVPLSGSYSRRSIVLPGYTPAEGEDMEVHYNGVGPGYFEAMGIRLTRGRGFNPADRVGAPDVVVVNEAFARRYWPGRDAIGQRIGLSGAEGPLAEVIGIVPDGKYRSLTEEPLPYMYYAHLQQPSSAMVLHVRTGIDPARVAGALREHVSSLAPSMPVPNVTTLRSQVAMATLPQRIAAAVLAVLGILALGIASIGLYGVVSYVVVQRTHEFGIRTALGAAARDVMTMVVMQGLRLALTGVAIGAVIALVLARLLGTLLLVSPADPVAIIGAAGLLTAVAALASWVPARRATRVDPLTALRSE